jgi:uncharacterized membrane protein YfcA
VLITAGLIVALAALVQGTVGYGMALVAAPLLAMVEPAYLPVPLILLTSAHAVLAAVRDWQHADWTGIGWAMAGRLPGTGLGVLAVVVLSPRVFALLVGLGVLICVLLSLLSWRPRPRPGSLLLAGLVSGVGGTAASIGGPPLALLYQEAAGPRVRGTISGYFVLGSVISLAALAAAGQVTGESLARTAALSPFLLIGFALSGPARRVLDNGWTRRAVLSVAAASAALLLGRVVLTSG